MYPRSSKATKWVDQVQTQTEYPLNESYIWLAIFFFFEGKKKPKEV
jgi:hypothetical protein